MSTKEEYAHKMLESHDKLKEALKLLSEECGNTFKVENVLMSFMDMFNKFCPFKVGERVRFVESFVTEDRSHGWHSCQHNLQKGAVSKVLERSYDHVNHRFTFLVEPEHQTWISSLDGEERVVSRLSCFGFGENWLEAVA